MESRSVLKLLREFALRELEEKCANRVFVRRVKMGEVMRRGRLPDLRVRAVEGAYYLVCVFRDDSLRVYYLDRGGRHLGASDLAGVEKEKVWKNVLKGTKNVFQAPS